MQQFGSKEKYLLTNTLSCIPVLLQGYDVMIDLRNETSVVGRIVNADGFMNINLEDAVFIDRDGLHYSFDHFMVRERMIRQIHIPPDFNVEQEIQNMLDHGLHRRKSVVKKKRTYKMKRAQTRHQEILKEIEKRQLEKEEAEKLTEGKEK